MISTPISVHSSSGSLDARFILALIRAIRPDDSFLPPHESAEQMKDIFAADGYTEELDWFTEC
jgi:hypothetical protein